MKDMEKQIEENKVDIKQLHAWFKEEIDRKDKEIERLKKENDVLFKTALRAQDKKVEYSKKHINNK